MAGRVCVRREVEHQGYHKDQRGCLEDAKKLDIQTKLPNITVMVHCNLASANKSDIPCAGTTKQRDTVGKLVTALMSQPLDRTNARQAQTPPLSTAKDH